jgi:serine/threonine protein kinase
MTATIRQGDTFVGAPFWMVPEVIRESVSNEKADIWSGGGRGSLVVFCGRSNGRRRLLAALLIKQ